jgi:hypothetical protein
VEGFAICNFPGIIRNEFFEFQGTSYGILGPDDCIGRTLVPRGTSPTFDDFFGTTQKAKVYCDVTEAVGAYILLQGFDQNYNWIQTQVAGEWIDGERVLLTTGPQLSVNYFTSITAVQKPVTNGPVRLYSYDVPSGANVKSLAIYESDETLPQYRRYMIPGLSQMGGGNSRNPPCSTDATCDQTQVDLLVKMAFIPVSKDTDYLVIGNLQALKLAVMAIKAEENNDWTAAERLMEGNVTNEYGIPSRRGGAIPLLEEELANWNGDGPVATPRIQDPALFGAGYIENFT